MIPAVLRVGGLLTARQVGVEFDLRTGMPRCASCKCNTVQHIDCRGMILLSYARPIDRNRTAQSVCTFCGVFHKLANKHIIFP